MRPYAVSAFLSALCVSAFSVAQAQSTAAGPIAATYQATADKIIHAALSDSSAWNRLALMTDTFGNRLSGSVALERTIDWVLAEMKKDGLANARTEPVMVPHWVRGAESAELVSPRAKPLPMLGLGGSVGTPKKGITAEVLVATSFDDLKAKAASAKGKIVLWDVPFTNYGATVAYRWAGASAAAKAGAVASLVRSVGPASIASPHTGAMGYDTSAAKIPTAAITVEDAMMLHRMADRGEKVVVHLSMEAHTLPDAPSRNVMSELVGREHPEEVVVLGGHIDSWDVGQGAMDDGDGLVVSWEAVRLLKRLGLTPRRTIRVVGWTNEENGTRGGIAYADARGADVARHVLAMESDGGTFRPIGFDFVGSDSAYAVLRQVSALLASIQADSLEKGGGEADIGPLMERGVPGMGLRTDPEKYFWYHHTNGDTMDKLDPADMARCVATMAVMAYVVADLPDPLPRGAPPK
ncbi:MAG TPA: M28 family metallopeptidase [Gemmatimonadales bacterium]|nr:M28 family metallopeptidase [Gemmatimonadales bacterium]